MVGYPGQALALDRLRPDAWVADVVYTPLETRLIAEARRRGCRVMTGRGMCVHQAAEAFRLFTGRTPDVDRMGRLFDRLCSERDAGLAAAG
jgi:shikimate dehydrogenase